MKSIPVSVLIIVHVIHHATGHGRLMDPPARNSMWRFGFPNPVNYNDNELFCGGWAVQWEQNMGKCGICGDPFQAEQPRPHEAGGQYAKGLIGRHYSIGQEIDIEIELTTNHYGHFELYLCPNNNPSQEATQDCLNRYPLYVSGTNDVKYIIPEDGKKKAIFQYQVALPPYVTCTQCVIQWTYFTGNQWGECKNGTEAQGCGKSEVFKNCADISILTSSAAAIPPLFVDDNLPYIFYKSNKKSESYSISPLVIRNQVCVPQTKYKIIPQMSEWCQTNCLRYPPNCPSQLCYCPTTCEATGDLKNQQGADLYCMDKCIIYPQKCPYQKCDCFEERNEYYL